MTKTEELLVTRYGLLLSLTDLAGLLNRSVDGLRITLSGNNQLARQIRPAKIKLGRRVMFKAAEVARFLDEAE
ncbi:MULTISPECIES: plasmid-related protein [Burkholderia]|uniref:plasmid-related protein n=1 Tax=Burkholderia TaxID=32008 RepID=UPI0009BB25C7|nr:MULTISPECIES: plasmid-related protein [Burkholderia]MDN7726272.1 DNA-binding protein [Burkholderia gladioli]NIE83015.1 DNA-binding protein [Burkholderia sp. Tr-860]NIF62128.1 DNA-binding protein [Burkholderia sp. Cy-647]NIF96268.1 DNA-binding protein [Burkholderia sp. Ax-1720]